MNAWLATVIRKSVFAVAIVWIGKLVENGVLTQGQADQFIEAAVAILVAVAVACWSKYIAPWLAAKFGSKTE